MSGRCVSSSNRSWVNGYGVFNCSNRSWVNGYGEVGEGREEVGGFDFVGSGM